MLIGAGFSPVAIHDHVSIEDVDVWSANGAISETRREGIRAVYRNASPEFAQLHAAQVTGERIVDHMLFAMAVGTKPA